MALSGAQALLSSAPGGVSGYHKRDPERVEAPGTPVKLDTCFLDVPVSKSMLRLLLLVFLGSKPLGTMGVKSKIERLQGLMKMRNLLNLFQ